jgi:prolyl 4-hydroxylase
MYKEFKTPLNSFIGGWFIPKKTCNDLIKYFNKNKELQNPGRFGIDDKFYIDKEHKDSMDILIDNNNNDFEINNYRNDLQQVLDLYQERYPEVRGLEKFNLESFNIQKYPKKGGFKSWHTERSSKKHSMRVLAFMTYLNDLEKGGTNFLYQKITTPSKKGLTLIWPVDFTHTHKSQICNKEKIITTGWFKFI